MHHKRAQYTSQKSPVYTTKEPHIHHKRACYAPQSPVSIYITKEPHIYITTEPHIHHDRALGTPKKTIFNTKQLDNAAAAAHIPPEGTPVMVLGPTGPAPHLCTVLGVTSSTLDVLLTRSI